VEDDGQYGLDHLDGLEPKVLLDEMNPPPAGRAAIGGNELAGTRRGSAEGTKPDSLVDTKGYDSRLSVHQTLSRPFQALLCGFQLSLLTAG
jgi:hypothetical protein